MQQANTSIMIHRVSDQVVYSSSIVTLTPGDIVATGTPAGIGSVRTPPAYFRAGDRSGLLVRRYRNADEPRRGADTWSRIEGELCPSTLTSGRRFWI